MQQRVSDTTAKTQATLDLADLHWAGDVWLVSALPRLLGSGLIREV